MDLSSFINDIMLAHPTAEVTVITISSSNAQLHQPPDSRSASDRPPERGHDFQVGGDDEEIVQRTTEAGTVEMKASAWARILSLGEAEIRRAIKSKVLSSRRKEDGRDSGAVMISSTDMGSYLRVRNAVRDGTTDEPEWWGDVVKTAGSGVRSSPCGSAKTPSVRIQGYEE